MRQRANRTWTIEFKSTCRPSPASLTHPHLCRLVKTHTLCNQMLVLFCLKKMPWSYNNFSGKQKSSRIALDQHTYRRLRFCHCKYCARTNHPTSANPHQHTNFVQGTQCYSLSLTCAYTSQIPGYATGCHHGESRSWQNMHKSNSWQTQTHCGTSARSSCTEWLWHNIIFFSVLAKLQFWKFWIMESQWNNWAWQM